MQDRVRKFRRILRWPTRPMSAIHPAPWTPPPRQGGRGANGLSNRGLPGASKKVEKSSCEPLAQRDKLTACSSRGLFTGPLHGASSRGLFTGPLHGASSRGLFTGPLHGASSMKWEVPAHAVHAVTDQARLRRRACGLRTRRLQRRRRHDPDAQRGRQVGLLPASRRGRQTPVTGGSTLNILGFPAGTTLETLVPEEHTRAGIPQFSVFEFGSLTTRNGIPLQRATKTGEPLPTRPDVRSYDAVAYQAVLDHSMFLIQGGLYSRDNSGQRYQHILSFSTGAPSTGSPVAGTWEGKGRSRSRLRPTIRRRSPPQELSKATSRLALPSTAAIRMSPGHSGTGKAGPQSIRTSHTKGPPCSLGKTFSEFGTLTENLRPRSARRFSHVGQVAITVSFMDTERAPYRHNVPPRDGQAKPWTFSSTGRAGQEAGGVFAFEWQGIERFLHGVFAAKKQP